jgi:hypothetical protein
LYKIGQLVNLDNFARLSAAVISMTYDWRRDCLTNGDGMDTASVELDATQNWKSSMLRIHRSANGVFTMSGQMDAEPMAELQLLISSEVNGHPIVLDLKDVTLVNEDAITFLERCESNGIKLENCPTYIREWIMRQRDGH